MTKSKKKITMNYDNYEAKIVEKYGVELVGWPCAKMANPGSIGSDNVFKLLAALEGPDTRTCYWKRLTPAQLDARKQRNAERVRNGETVYKPRKKVVRKKNTAKSAETVVSDNDESEGEGEGTGTGMGEGEGEGEGAGTGEVSESSE